MDLPKFKAAAVQAAPVYMDAEATVGKVCSLIDEAGQNGASLVAFPEVFVPGYPYWNWIMDPVAGADWHEKLYKNSVDVPGPLVSRMGEAARRNQMYVVIGVNERGKNSLGVIYNTLLLFGPDGQLIGKHRKLVPTWAEKLTWTNGDGSTLKVHQTELGGVGMLACGENTNTLARFTLLAQGELVHIASYIALPVAPSGYDMAEAIRIRSSAHSFEGKLFSIISCSTISEEIIQTFESCRPDLRQLMERKRSAFSGIVGPDGNVVGTALIDEEGIVYADIDLNTCIKPKLMHDIIGHYNRFDIFNLQVNMSEQGPLEMRRTGRGMEFRGQRDAARTEDEFRHEPTACEAGSTPERMSWNGRESAK
ncbi:carbon-nitrogen hydrolase family protein [Halomonas sp. AOP42-C1-46]|uniref:carbon-nitrogen hydrolase family protein n=1 Tax=Halomonas sp. AOP42-C1-46 TaxID=3457671 RepID=UPI00403344BC